MYAATTWGYRHPRFVTGVRIAVATWNLFIGTVMLTSGYWEGGLLLAVSALVFCAAYIFARGYSNTRRQSQS